MIRDTVQRGLNESNKTKGTERRRIEAGWLGEEERRREKKDNMDKQDGASGMDSEVDE